MPKIAEYTPESAGAGPVGGVDPNLEVVAQGGHGIAAFGRDLDNANDVLQNRIGQMESSDAAAKVADLRDKYTQQIEDQTANGTLDVQTIRNQYQDEISELGQQFDTPSGKDTFNRQSARLGGTLAIRAVRGQTLVAVNNTKTDFESFLNTTADTVRKDPSQFQDAYDGAMEHLNTLGQQGLIPPSAMPKAVENVKLQFATATVMGIADSNPKAAQEALESKQFHGFLNQQQYDVLQNHIKQAQTASDIETERAYRLKKEAQDAKSEAWGSQYLPKLVDHSLSSRAILDSPMTWEQKDRWLGMLKSSLKDGNLADPALKNSLYDRMLLPDSDPRKIADPAVLQDYVVAGKISANDYKEMTSWYDKTPQGQAINANRKAVLDLAKAQLVQRGGMMGGTDPDGQLQLMKFTTQMQQAEAEARANHQPVSELYNPTSNKFLGKQIQKFIMTPQQRMSNESQRMQDSFNAPAPANAPSNDAQSNAPQDATTQAPKKKTPPAGYDRMVKGPDGKRQWLLKGQGIPKGYEEIK